MLPQLTISLLAVTMTATSPLLHYWEHAVEASAQADSDCCDGCHAAAPSITPDVPEQSKDDDQTCDCKYRVAVPQGLFCDIGELTAKQLPGNHMLVSFDAPGGRGECSLGPCCNTPVHFSPAADGGDLCARLGRHLI